MRYPIFITIFRKLLLSENHVAKMKISVRIKVKVLAP